MNAKNSLRMNLHCHSNFSDGKHNIKQMVLEAIRYKFKYLAITDHFTNSWKSKIIPSLNSIEKIKKYLNEICKYKKFLRVKHIKLQLFKGIEIDVESSEKYIKSLIQPQNFELILFEYLETLEGISYIKNIIDFWKKSNPSKKAPIYGLAHFDPSNFIHNGLDRLIQFLKQYEIYFEFNTRYSEFYSWKNVIFFEKLRKYEIPVAVGSDAHNSKDLCLIDDALNSIRDYKLQNNLNILQMSLNRI